MNQLCSLEPLHVPPLTIGFDRTEILSGPDAAARLFRRQRAIACPKLFDAGLLDRLRERGLTGQFREDRVEGLGTREVEEPQTVGGAINLLLRRENFLTWVAQATGTGPLTTVTGRVVQTRANGRDRLHWHDDLNDRSRRLGITISLSDAPYGGGDFELRVKGGEAKTIWVFRHDTPGTALIFDVNPGLEHRLTPLVSGGPRRVFTGWFLQDRTMTLGRARQPLKE